MQQIHYQIYSTGSGSSGLLLAKNTNNFKHNFHQHYKLACEDNNCTIQKDLEDLTEFTKCYNPILEQVDKFKINGLFGLYCDYNNNLYIWGQLDQTYQIPKQIQIQEKVLNFACGWMHGIINTENCLYGLGSNKFYELGLGQKQFYKDPIKLEFQVDNISDIICGFRNSIIISNNKLYGCGANKMNELGIENGKNLEQFVELINLNIKTIKFGQKFTVALTKNYELYGWGSNGFGQLDKQEVKVSTIRKLMENVKHFDCGWNHLIVLNNENEVYIRGRGDMGQQGDGLKINNYEFKKIDIQAFNVKCGSESTFILNNKHLYASGWNEHGNLGNGNKENIYTFVKLDFAKKIKARGAVSYKFK